MQVHDYSHVWVARMSTKGQLVIPEEARKLLGWKEGDLIVVDLTEFDDEMGILMTKMKPTMKRRVSAKRKPGAKTTKE